MVVNDNAVCLTPHSVFRFIASKLAPTIDGPQFIASKRRASALDRRNMPKHLLHKRHALFDRFTHATRLQVFQPRLDRMTAA